MDSQPADPVSDLISQLIAEARLPARPSTQRLLLRAAAAMARLDHKSLKQTDFADTSWMPGEETLQPLIAAALDHAADANCMSFLVKVPGTTPELLIAMGDKQHLVEILELKSARWPADAGSANDASTN